MGNFCDSLFSFCLMVKRLLLTLLISVVVSGYAHGHNIRYIDTSSGLSSQFVLSLCQDESGFIWAGAYSGLNMIAGSVCLPFGFGSGNFQTTGNCINRVLSSGDAIWISSNVGLERYNPQNGSIERHNHFRGSYRIFSSQGGDMLVMTEGGKVYAYNAKSHQFDLMRNLGVNRNTLRQIVIDKQHNILILEQDRLRQGRLVQDDEGVTSCQLHSTIKLIGDNQIVSAYYDGKYLFVVNSNYDLMMTSSFSEMPVFQYNMRKLMEEYGVISTIVREHNNIIIGFLTSGVVSLTYSGKGQYEARLLPVKHGVFDILRDARQDVIWLATDGEGLCAIVNEPYTIHNENLQNMPVPVSKPVRAIMMDKQGRLWVGTKGDGIVTIDNYHPFGSSGKISQYTQSNSLLADNSVYSFTSSRRNLLWIGTDGSYLNYYSFASQSICRLDVKGADFRFIHDIVEVSKDELWIATSGYGVIQVFLSGPDDHLQVKSARRYLYFPKSPSKSQFFSIAQQGDRYLWFCDRNLGIFRYDRRTGKFMLLRFKVKPKDFDVLQLENDPLDICVAPDGKLFCATSSGIIEFYQSNGKYYWKKLNLGESKSNTVFRSIIYQKGGFIWACSPSTIMRYHIATGQVKSFNHTSGIDVQELNDDAAYYDEKSGIKYFGGIGRLVAISPSVPNADQSYHPDLYFLYARMDNEFYGVDRQNTPNLVFEHDNNNFTLYYSAPDYINGDSYRYEYRFNNSEWIDNGNQCFLNITNMKPGYYNLQMRYVTGNYTSKVYKFAFRINPPWYFSWWMELLYCLLAMLLVAYVVRKYYLRQKERREHAMESLKRKHKEDVYESKLRFFTNITHEFATPISLIVGPCQRILSNSTIPTQIRNHAILIQHNCERLNGLIQDIMEFRRIESDHLELTVEKVDISTMVQKIVDDFNFLADKQQVGFSVAVAKNIEWPTDSNAFVTLVTNLLSYAFKYTPSQGCIDFSMHVEDDSLLLQFTNHGTLISQEQIPTMFDHYRILERLEDKTESKRSRYDIGLAISQGLIKLLKGNIQVHSNATSTIFDVKFPRIELSEARSDGLNPPATYISRKASLASPSLDTRLSKRKIDSDKSTVIIIDDNEEMLWLLGDFFSENYNVSIYKDPNQALQELIEYNPDVIISDVMMQSASGIDICRQLKANPITAHIPVILLSSINTDEERIKGIKAGADMYISRPCDMDYLHSAVEKFIKNKEVLKNYYESPLSSMIRMNAKFINKEDKKLYDQMMDVINKNLDNPKLSTKFIADEMAMTVRSLYRKLESFTKESPTTIIRESRLEQARILLIKTNLTVEEICYKVGFSTRGTFYRLFAERFHCTPKQYHDRKVNQAEDAISSLTDT